MRIIDRIEINYFRSLYSLNLSNPNDMTLFVGGNDVGKSNIFKALNLFFNNAPDLEADFDFLETSLVFESMKRDRPEAEP